VGGEFADSSSLPAELQRLLSTMRELDERSQSNSFSLLSQMTEFLCNYLSQCLRMILS
jgi:hypothetical protein